MSGWDEVVENNPPAQSDEAPETATRYTGVSLTLKSDGAYDAPWYVIHGANASDILNQLRDPALPALLQEVTKHSTGWAKHQLAAKGLTPVANSGGQQRPSNQGQQQTQQTNAAASQPDEPAPSCEHGPRQWKDFVSSKGNHVKGWFCTQQGSDCKPLYRK